MKKNFLRATSAAVSLSLLLGASAVCAVGTEYPANANGSSTSTMLLKLNESVSKLDGTMINNSVYDSGFVSRLIVVNSSTMLPMRFVCESLGYTVGYNYATNNSTITNPKNGVVIELYTGTTKMVKTNTDGSTQELHSTVATILVNGVTHVPVRSLLEAFGHYIGWDERGYVLISDSEVSTTDFNNLINSWGQSDGGGSEEEDPLEPPYPFWKNYKDYSSGDRVYYMGKIYEAQWWNNNSTPASGALWGDPWKLIGDAEWTVPENPDNYTSPETGGSSGGPDSSLQLGVPVKLTDSEITTKWGGINPEYSSTAAVSRLESCLSKSYYEELFPLRFGSEKWKTLTDYYYTGSNRQNQPDYYSHENLKQAISELANLMIRVEWFADSEYCYRIIRLDKTTKEEMLVYQQDDWTAEWNLTKTPLTQIVDFGTFLAEGSETDKKRELAAFLANISHETGGGNVDGIYNEIETGLYFNEEVNYIGATSSGYTASTYPSAAGHSYHGRGPIQTSWNYNYGKLSGIIYGDINVLLNEPERLSSDGVLGFKAAIQFWMTPAAPKPSCHDIMTNKWTPTASAIAGGITQSCFGTTIMVINGGLEGNLTVSDYRVGRRARYYQTFASKMGINVSGEKVDTAGMTKF